MNSWFLLIPTLILIIGYFLFPSIIVLATKLNYLDEAKGRKRHKDSIPPIGGWLLYAAASISYLILFLLPSPSLQNFGVFLSFTGVFVLGLIDDKFPLNAKQKFLGQFIIAALLVFIGEVHFASYLSIYGFPLFLGKLLAIVLVVFVLNAYNLVDGINGLAALLGIVALGFLGLWLFSAGKNDFFIFSLSIIAALLVFLRYNVFKTMVFLGDNGSMLIGLFAVYFAFSFIKIYTDFSSIVMGKCEAELGIALAALAIPLADTVRLFLLRPYYLSKSPFKADRNHVHHLLLRLGFSHVEASLSLFGLAVLLVFSAIAAQNLGNFAVIFITLSVCIAFLMAIDFFVYSKYRRRVDKKTMFNSLQNLSKDLNHPVFIESTFAISIFILAISIPFHRVSTSIPTIILVFSFLVLFIRNWVIYKNGYFVIFTDKAKQFLKQPYTILIVLFLIFTTFHILVFKPSNHLEKLTIYALLLVYWITIFQLEKIIQIKPRVLLTAYVAGCFVFGVYIIIQSFIKYPLHGWSGFFYRDLLSNVKANPVTHSLYYNLAILFLGNNYKYLKREEWRISYWFLFVFFVFMVMLCSAKIGLVVLILTFISAIYNFISNKKTAYILITVFLISVLFIALRLNLFSQDFVLVALDSRTIVWQESLGLIKENFWFGSGVGSSISELGKAFELIGFERGIIQKYNAQNQFLESFLETGFIGFLLLLAFFAYGFLKAFLEGNKLYFVYLLVIFCYMVGESLFQTQMGMVSFAFFNALFLASLYKNDKGSA